MARGLLLRHPSSGEHDTGAHPERAERIVAIEEALAERGWLDCDVTESPPAGRDLLEAVHHADAQRAMGFCLFNNVAIAARHALDAHGLERVLVPSAIAANVNGVAVPPVCGRHAERPPSR